MASEEKLITIYTGSEVNVQHLQNIFDDVGINFIVKNDSESAIRAGFGPIMPGQARLIVWESQSEKAKQIVDETFPKYSEDNDGEDEEE